MAKAGETLPPPPPPPTSTYHPDHPYHHRAGPYSRVV